MAKNSGRVSLARFLKDADERVREAAANALNETAEGLISKIKDNMNAQGIREKTGNLRGSIKSTKATAKSPTVRIESEVFARNPKTGEIAIPKNPGSRNPAMKGRYKDGVPYGRLIEFSPRINKPFFYTAWYQEKARIREDIINVIGKAWSGK